MSNTLYSRWQSSFSPEVLLIAEVGYDGSPPGGEFANGSHSLCRIVLQSIGLVIPEFLALGHQDSPQKKIDNQMPLSGTLIDHVAWGLNLEDYNP